MGEKTFSDDKNIYNEWKNSKALSDLNTKQMGFICWW